MAVSTAPNFQLIFVSLDVCVRSIFAVLHGAQHVACFCRDFSDAEWHTCSIVSWSAAAMLLHVLQISKIHHIVVLACPYGNGCHKVVFTRAEHQQRDGL